MNYYEKKQTLVKVNEKDEIIEEVEKWEAHRKGILHRGYTAILTVESNIVMQYRKHSVFDKVFDLSFSSHQTIQKGKLQSNEEAVLDGLEREWGIQEKDIQKEPQFIQSFYYKAFDDRGGYYEHEIDYVFSVELKHVPQTNPDFAYGMMLLHKDEIRQLRDVRMQILLAPWVDKMLQSNFLS